MSAFYTLGRLLAAGTGLMLLLVMVPIGILCPELIDSDTRSFAGAPKNAHLPELLCYLVVGMLLLCPNHFTMHPVLFWPRLVLNVVVAAFCAYVGSCGLVEWALGTVDPAILTMVVPSLLLAIFLPARCS